MAVDSIGWNEPVQTGEDENGTPVGVSGWDATQGEREYERRGRADYGDDWMNAIQNQERQRQSEENNAIAQQSERVFEDFNNIALRDQQQKIQKRQMDDATLSALMRQAQTNNGFVPASVLEAASQNLGVPLAGANFGEDGMFYLWGRDGKTGQMVPIGGATPEMQYGVYERSRTGLAQRQKIFDNLSRRFTPEQLSKIGIKDTRGAVEVSPGVRDKGGMFSQMMDPWKGRHSSIGAFSADGKGGFTRYYSGEETGHQLVSRDFGTRATDGAEQWRQISVGADPNSDDGTQVRRYENSRTGEVVSVRDGETPPWEERGRGDRERIARINAASREKQAQIQAQGRADSAQISAELKRLGYDIDAAKLEELRRHNQETEKNVATRGAERSGGRYDKNLIADLKERAKAFAPKIENDDGEMVDNPNADPVKYKQINDRIDAQLGIGGGEDTASPAQGGESESERLRRENERLMALKAARQQQGAPTQQMRPSPQPDTPPQNAVRRPSGADIVGKSVAQGDKGGAKKKRKPPKGSAQDSTSPVPTLDATSSVANTTTVAVGGGGRRPTRDFSAKPVMPEERYAEAEKRWREYYRQRKALGYEAATEDQIQDAIYNDLKDEIGEEGARQAMPNYAPKAK